MEAHSYRSLSKKRTTNFREDETKVLIQLWGSPQIQNKLYLTHRKEPVMRLLAANMQQRGFYRTPDEIKTRIRNLKCLYHRIKRSLQSGAGIGTVDPDWPHYKAMDNILTRQTQKKENLYKDNVFEGPRCEDIKQEIDDIDINDDMESYTTNSMAGSEYEEEPINLPPLTPAPGNKEPPKKTPNEKINVYNQHQVKPLPKILPLPAQNHHQIINAGQKQPGQISSLPFPLLILNGMPTQTSTEKKEDFKINSQPKPESDINGILRELVEIQKENLDVEKQRLELDKQKFEFERFIGTQLLAFGPVFTGILQRCAYPQDLTGSTASEDFQNKNNNTQRKRSASSADLEILKDSKILKTILTQSIRKYMMGEEISDDDNDDNSKGSDK